MVNVPCFFTVFLANVHRLFTKCSIDVQRMFNVQLCLKHVRRCSPVVAERSAGLRTPDWRATFLSFTASRTGGLCRRWSPTRVPLVARYQCWCVRARTLRSRLRRAR